MLRTRLKIWKLNRQRRKLEKESRRVRAESLAKKDDRIYEDWHAEHRWEFELVDATIKGAISRDLVNEAENLYLPTPDYGAGERWEQQLDGSYALTPEAMTELRAAIRKERRERREVIEWWVKVVGGAIGILTGLVGALIGLIAIWKKS